MASILNISIERVSLSGRILTGPTAQYNILSITTKITGLTPADAERNLTVYLQLAAHPISAHAAEIETAGFRLSNVVIGWYAIKIPHPLTVTSYTYVSNILVQDPVRLANYKTALDRRWATIEGRVVLYQGAFPDRAIDKDVRFPITSL